MNNFCNKQFEIVYCVKNILTTSGKPSNTWKRVMQKQLLLH